ncbi:MAG: metallophosphoesterase [Oscillospiraceae bacterium]|nr:metallophosphoesterase [Oscillospiraceae bacterium]
MMKKRRKLKIFLLACAILALTVTGYILISGWIGGLPKLNYNYGENISPGPAYPDTDFIVISDIHAYDPSLGTSGSAFESVMKSDRKLLPESLELLDYAVGEILNSDAKFVIIPGDLTKDGEIINHNILAQRLSKLTDAGIGVYVVPGNHDVNSPDALSFSGDISTPVDSASREDFSRIYEPFGYGAALKRDSGSLSYAAEPVDGLWLLAVDACRFDENTPGQKAAVGGKISQATADWIAETLEEADKLGKAVIAVMHHGAAEHWKGQSKLHPDYLIDEYKYFGELLASYNVRLIFTGHYHAQDITRADFKNDKYIYDVETGSLITAPCPIRYCSIRDNIFSSETLTIVDKIRPGTDFAQKSTDFVKTTVMLEAINTLKKYNVSDKDSDIIADAVGDAFAAHYAGDENPDFRPFLDKSELSLWGRFILFMQQYVLDGLWADLEPGDNNISFSLD